MPRQHRNPSCHLLPAGQARPQALYGYFVSPPFSPQAADPRSWSRSPHHGAGCTCASGNPLKINNFWQELRAWMTSFDAPDAKPGASQLTSRLLLSSRPLAGPSTRPGEESCPKTRGTGAHLPSPSPHQEPEFSAWLWGADFFRLCKVSRSFLLLFFFLIQHLHSGTGSTPGCWPCSRGAAPKKAPKGIKDHRSPNLRSRPVPGLSKAHEHTCLGVPGY